MKQYVKYLSILLIILMFFVSHAMSQKNFYIVKNDHTGETEYNHFTKNTLSDEEVFIFENDTLLQKLVLNKIDSTEFNFTLLSTNKLRNQTAQIEGVASNKEGIIEVDENEEGEVYLVYVYTFEGDCYLEFRVDIESFKIVKIFAADCITINSFCPFFSVGLLKKVE
ncbi:MAG TPA: hypothetical protein GX007_06065 [Bacteroidales bacterium]|jgi:hypothetical protein|nr:hypothetical protein [Bacteroidales bacterium]